MTDKVVAPDPAVIEQNTSCVVGVLAEALAQHRWRSLEWCCKCGDTTVSVEQWPAHVASVVTALPNIAILELPEREKGVWFVGDGQSHVERVAGSAMWVRDSANNIVHIPNPRALALALLAATQSGEKS